MITFVGVGDLISGFDAGERRAADTAALREALGPIFRGLDLNSGPSGHRADTLPQIWCILNVYLRINMYKNQFENRQSLKAHAISKKTQFRMKVEKRLLKSSLSMNERS